MSASCSQNFHLYLLFTLFLVSQITNAENLNDWLHDGPKDGVTLVEEIQCYSLPYGGIGFASHLLTYYTIGMLSAGRSPFLPWRRLSSTKIDMCLTGASFIGTVIISFLTIVRCRARWQFVAIAIWKLTLSVTLCILSLHASILVAIWDEDELPYILFWLLLYIPGVATGLVGVISLVIQTISTNHNVLIITVVFGSVILAAAALVFIFTYFTYFSGGSKGYHILVPFVAILAGTGILGALYSDWILAAVAENMAGAPSSDNFALYWSYFILKRFPFFAV